MWVFRDGVSFLAIEFFNHYTFAKAPNMKIKEIEISKVIPYARNPRNNVDAVAGVAASLKEYGWQQPIVVDSEMVVVVGHTRLLAAQQLGFEMVPVHIASDLSPQQIKAYRLADNRVGENATWDNELLKIEFDDLESDGFDLDLTGFTADEINKKEEEYTTNDDNFLIDENENSVIVKTENENECAELFEELKGRGFKCEIMS
jgi:ParB-like chromosome segregation protein Spo0J